jgi:hypothetical protein
MHDDQHARRRDTPQIVSFRDPKKIVAPRARDAFGKCLSRTRAIAAEIRHIRITSFPRARARDGLRNSPTSRRAVSLLFLAIADGKEIEYRVGYRGFKCGHNL